MTIGVHADDKAVVRAEDEGAQRGETGECQGRREGQSFSLCY